MLQDRLGRLALLAKCHEFFVGYFSVVVLVIIMHDKAECDLIEFEFVIWANQAAVRQIHLSNEGKLLGILLDVALARDSCDEPWEWAKSQELFIDDSIQQANRFKSEWAVILVSLWIEMDCSVPDR